MPDTTRSERPYWYETNGMIVCQYCRRKMLDQWAPGTQRVGSEFRRDFEGRMVEVRGVVSISEDETVRPRDFEPLGRTPWAGNPPGDRYMQCDNCNGQWGPDA